MVVQKSTIKADLNIVLFSGNEALGLKILYCLFPIFKNIHIIAKDEQNILKFSRYKKDFIYIPWDVEDRFSKNIAERIEDYCRKNNIDVIIPDDMSANAYLYKNSIFFKNHKIFPCMSKEALVEIDDKWVFAKKLMSTGIPTPKTILIDQFDGTSETYKAKIDEEIGYPLIIKPLHGESSHGVEKINDFNELKDHILSDKPYNGLPLIVQKFIDGYDIDFSFIADGGIIQSMAVQMWVNKNELKFCRNATVENIGNEIAKLFTYNGAGHIDMRIDTRSGDVYVLECNPRFWFTITAAKWKGLNFAEAAVDYTVIKKCQFEGAEGIYYLPGARAKMLIKKPWAYFTFSKDQKDELWIILKDFILHLRNFLKK